MAQARINKCKNLYSNRQYDRVCAIAKSQLSCVTMQARESSSDDELDRRAAEPGEATLNEILARLDKS